MSHERHERAIVAPSVADPVQLTSQGRGQRALSVYAALEDALHDRIEAQPRDRRAKHRDVVQAEQNVRQHGTSSYTAPAVVVVGIDRDDGADTGVVSGGKQQGDAPTDRFPHDHSISNVELVQKLRYARDEELGRIGRLWNGGVAMPGVVQSIDPKPFREVGDDFLEHIELGSQGVQQDQGRSLATGDVAKLRALYVDIADGNVRRPVEAIRCHRSGAERLYHVGHRNECGERTQEYHCLPGHRGSLSRSSRPLTSNITLLYDITRLWPNRFPASSAGNASASRRVRRFSTRRDACSCSADTKPRPCAPSPRRSGTRRRPSTTISRTRKRSWPSSPPSTSVPSPRRCRTSAPYLTPSSGFAGRAAPTSPSAWLTRCTTGFCSCRAGPRRAQTDPRSPHLARMP